MARMANPLGQPGGFSTIIDARSEGEYALDHLPGAVNWPSLNNEERIFVGTLYKQQGAFEAQKHGAALVAANISRHIQREVLTLAKNWQPLIYCWRGGKRSGSLSMVLGQIGFKIYLIEGGYKAFRAALVDDIPQRVAPLQFRIISGPTGSGKTRLLHALAAEGAQVLDLEDLACHRSSVLGHIPGQPQPSQKHFDTLIWQALRSFDPSRPVFVESLGCLGGHPRQSGGGSLEGAGPCRSHRRCGARSVGLALRPDLCLVDGAQLHTSRSSHSLCGRQPPPREFA